MALKASLSTSHADGVLALGDHLPERIQIPFQREVGQRLPHLVLGEVCAFMAGDEHVVRPFCPWCAGFLFLMTLPSGLGLGRRHLLAQHLHEEMWAWQVALAEKVRAVRLHE